MNSIEELLTDLTDPQKEAATHLDGPLLIVAGAGSGKTRVITRRVAYLVANGIPPASILAITFTNKAAGEMKQRIGAAMGRTLRDFGRLDQPWPTICTFHSLCLRILKHFATRVNLPANFTIYDSADQTKLIKEALKILDLSSTNFPAGTVHATISNAKNQLIDAAAFAQSAGDFYQRTVARIYTKYQQLLAANNALDFDDLLLRTAQAFRDHPDVLKETQDRYHYLLIDEYQDTNHSQYVVAHALAPRHRNICVVGDPDQSIYAWRGADIRNILDFEKDYPDAKVIRLEQNYRSTKTILHIASTLIARNRQRKEKTLWTENDQGEKAEHYICQDEHEEANIVTRRLRELHAVGGYQWNQMAIFYRMNSLSRVIEDALRKGGVPYQIARGVEFYNRKEIKDVLAYLRVVNNPADEINLDRIINTPARGIGDASVRQMSTQAAATGRTLWEVLQSPGGVGGLSTRAVKAIGVFVQAIHRWRKLAGLSQFAAGDVLFGTGSVAAEQAARQPGGVRAVMEAVVKQSGLEALFEKEDPDRENQVPNVAELISAAAEYDQENPEGSLDDYLSRVSLVSDVDQIKDGGGAVTLMTLHAAKGLEFPVVAIIGLEEGCLPHARARGNEKEMEEERRLCFVGVTRAEERLILSRAAYRTIRGLRERTVASPFLGEMPGDSLAVTDHTGMALDNDGYETARSENDALNAKFRRGQLVRHAQFGLGRISEVSNMGSQTRAVVEFNKAGRKTLILQYARLEVVG